MPASIGSNQPSKRWTGSLSGSEESAFVVLLVMAWSPVRRFNAGRFEVDHPGDYATLNSHQPRDGTNVFIERLWRSLKYECVFLNAFQTGSEARMGIGHWIGYYNADRPHSALAGRTPNEVYATQATEEKLAA